MIWSTWVAISVGAWSHQNAYRRKRYLQQTLGTRSLFAEQARTAGGRPRCWATVAGGKRRCGLSPLPGTDVCRFHGGAAPQTKRLAVIRDGIVRAAALVKRLDLDRATKKDPREVLLEQVHTAAAMAAATKDLVVEVDVEALTDPGSEGFAKAKQTHELFALWQERAAKSAKMALDIGIDEALVKLAEMQARAMVRALKSVLGADVLGLTSGQQKIAQQLLGQHLRSLVPDLEGTPTTSVEVEGELIPYNPAMDQYMARLDAPGRAANQAYRAAQRSKMRDRARLGRTEGIGPSQSVGAGTTD